MPELINISYEIENDINIWFKVEIELIKDKTIFEVLTNDDQEYTLLSEIFYLLPIIRQFELIQYPSKENPKIDMSEFVRLHSQINQFVARHEFRNVDPNDFLAINTVDGNKRKLNLKG